MSIDPALMETSPTPTSDAKSPHSPLSLRTGQDGHEQLHVYNRQPAAFQGTGGWDSYTGEWVQGDIFPIGPGGDYYPDRSGRRQFSTLMDSGDPQPAVYYKEGDEGSPRKKRKGREEDGDYQPAGQRRVCFPYESCISTIDALYTVFRAQVPASYQAISSPYTVRRVGAGDEL
jgi:DNA helicase INO80